MAKITKCNGCPEKEATLDIATMKPGTVFRHGGGIYLRTGLPVGVEGCLVHMESGLTYSHNTPSSWRPEPLDSDYLIHKEQ